MGFALAKALLVAQLSLLCFTLSAYADEEQLAVAPAPYHHGHYPAMAPSSHHHHHHHHHHHALAPPPTNPHHHAPPPAPTSHHHLAPAPAPSSHHHHQQQPPTHAPSPSPTHHHHHHPPTHTPPPAHAPPVHTPKPYPPPPPAASHPPMAPPAAKPPTYHFPRSFVAVQGVVYCKPCKYAGVDTLLGATPVLGATVKLQCNNTKYPLVVKGTTDKNGYFFLEAPKGITSYGAHKCRVSLVSSPDASCGKPTDFHGGISGGVLRPEKEYVDPRKLPFVLFAVGPFAFEPKICPR